MDDSNNISEEVKDLLLQKATQYNQLSFIESDPISVPHRFTIKQDIEIAGLLAATIAWGNRKMIVNNARKMVELMDYAPYDFVKNHSTRDLETLKPFVHRTFNGGDFIFFVEALQILYEEQRSLEAYFKPNASDMNMMNGIENFRSALLSAPHETRIEKHIASPLKGSASKRLTMFLRWMVRKDKCGVDFGVWKEISPALLSCPLDVHSGNVARKLGLLQRKQNDWKAVNELDISLRKIDPKDPARLDFALFGLGVFEGF